MRGRDKKEFKLVIHKDRDPEVYKWALSLNYGLFPKFMIEILRWYEKNGLLVKGGVASPDLLIDLNKKPPILEVSDFEKQVLEKLNSLEDLLKNSNFEGLASFPSDDNPNVALVNKVISFEQTEFRSDVEIDSLSTDQVEPDMQNKTEPEPEQSTFAMPMQSNFKVYKYQKKED